MEVAAKAKARIEALRKELKGLKPSQLKVCARAVGVTDEQLEEADDSDDHEGALIELVVDGTNS